MEDSSLLRPFDVDLELERESAKDVKVLHYRYGVHRSPRGLPNR